MDLIIKNLERLKDYSNGNHKPIERVVIDFDKLATEDFAQVFFDSCEEYKEPKTGNWITHPKGIYAHLICDKCLSNAPYDCQTNYCPNCGAKMESAEPTLKEVTERMQSEFDATGIDTKIFMNERIIKR